MKKKISFGFVRDDKNIRVAHLEQDQYGIVVKNLAEFKFDDIKLGKEKEQKKSNNENLSVSDIHALLNPEDDLVVEEDKNADEDNKPHKEKETFNQFLLDFPLDHGKICLATDSNEFSWINPDIDLESESIDKYINKTLLSKADKKNDNIGYDSFINSEQKPIILLKKKKLFLTQKVEEHANLINKKLHFDKIVPSEIVLWNALKRNYDLNDDTLTVVLYFGYQQRFGLIFKGEEFHSRFDLKVNEKDKERLRQKVFSKLILEQDTGHIPAGKIDNLLISGKNVLEDDIKFFASKNFATNIDYFELNTVSFAPELEKKLDKRIISHFLLSISLAQSFFEKKSKNFIHINLISNSIKEKQQQLKLAWHGYLLMGIMFAMTLVLTYSFLKFDSDLSAANNKNAYLKNELNHVRQQTNQIRGMKMQIAQLKENIIKVDKIIQNKNQWSFILFKLQKYFSNNRLGWLIALEHNQDDEENKSFVAKGYTIDRREVNKLSNVFEKAINKEVFREEIQGHEVWKYIITFEYPDRQKRLIEEEKKIREQTKSYKPQKTNAPLTDKEAYNEIARIYLDGNHNVAYQRLLQFLDDFPESRLIYPAKYLIAEYYFSYGSLGKSAEILESLKKENSYRQEEVLFLLSKTYHRLNKPELARQNYTTLISEFSGSKLSEDLINYYKGNI